MKVRKYISRWLQLFHEHVLSCSSHFKTYLGKSLGPSRSLGSPNTDLKMSLRLTMPLRTNIPYKHGLSSMHWKILRSYETQLHITSRNSFPGPSQNQSAGERPWSSGKGQDGGRST